MTKRVLHTLSQRPQQTGSGITLDELIRHGSRASWIQEAIVGVPFSSALPVVGGLTPPKIHSVEFGTPLLNFPVPGMSDVMPYESSQWSSLTRAQLEDYKETWSKILIKAVNEFRPSLIHTNHIWILSSLLKQLFPSIPVVAHCHATGLRQMELCPHLKDEVVSGCKMIDAFAVLHSDHKEKLAKICEIDHKQIHIVGAGFNPHIFSVLESADENVLKTHHGKTETINIAYAGKYSLAKGLGSLLDAVDLLNNRGKAVVLHVAGSGSGAEAEMLKNRMLKMGKEVVLYGQVNQKGLSEIFNRCSVIALTSFYEGLPLVLIEALSCGCRIVCTKLPGIVNELVPWIKDYMELVSLPPMKTIDKPEFGHLPAFAEEIAVAIVAASKKLPVKKENKLKEEVETLLSRFTWGGVFDRVEAIWTSLI